MLDLIAFYVLALIAIVASLLVVAQKNLMYSVMLLITSFGALAVLCVLLDAPFTAVTQIIIYAGAIMVLFLFVVMLLNIPREEAIASRMGADAAERDAGRDRRRRIDFVGGADRQRAVHDLRLRLRSDVAADSGRHGRRRGDCP